MKAYKDFPTKIASIPFFFIFSMVKSKEDVFCLFHNLKQLKTDPTMAFVMSYNFTRFVKTNLKDIDLLDQVHFPVKCWI